MHLAVRAPPPPILLLGVLVHAFVAAAGVLQNDKLWLCSFAVEISEGPRQFLIVIYMFSMFSVNLYCATRLWRSTALVAKNASEIYQK